jgi:hypothetical protein
MKWFNNKNSKEQLLLDKKIKVIDDELNRLHVLVKEHKTLQEYDKMMDEYTKMVILIEKRNELKPMSITERITYKALQRLSGKVDANIRQAVESKFNDDMKKVE